MSKYKRKPSAAQRDKTVIETAKKLKKAGILSKQVNLHSGQYVSRDVLRKVRELQAIANLNYKAIAVPKKLAKAAKERGYQVVQGNKIIGPSSQKFRNRLKKGELTGVRPVRGGYMEEVTMPHNVVDLYTLTRQLEDGIDTLKADDEYFAFKYKGAESYRTFRNSQELLNYLQQYKGITRAMESFRAEDLQEEFDALTIFRLNKNTVRQNIPTPAQRQKRKALKKLEDAKNGIFAKRAKRKNRTEIAAALGPVDGAAYLERMAAKDKKRRDKLKANPEKMERMREAARIRQQKSRANRKG